MIYGTLSKAKTHESAKHRIPFREKLKKTFSRHSTSGENSSDSATRKNSNFYQPGEHIPYKYKRPVQKEHKEKLESFSFAKAWRRRSHQSVYSPMGSRMPSRQGSIASAMRRSIGSRRDGGSIGPMGERSSVSDGRFEPARSHGCSLKTDQLVSSALETTHR
jgi:hypothetical protein